MDAMYEAEKRGSDVRAGAGGSTYSIEVAVFGGDPLFPFHHHASPYCGAPLPPLQSTGLPN